MDIIQALVLGAVQGLGEFLPISSSAHLVLTPWLFGWKDPGLGFDVALHWGTLLAVLAYFRNDIWLLARGFFHSLRPSTRDMHNNIYQKLSWFLIIASIPGAIIGKLLESQAESVFRNPLLIAATLSGFGVVILIIDRFGKREKNLDRLGAGDAVLIGLSQALAIIPGVSRSGATISMGLLRGLKREDAARFSFLMSAPIIFGAGLAQIGNFGQGASAAGLVAGFISAAIFGFFSIRYLLRYITSHTFAVFIWYRFALAAAVFILYAVRNS